MPDSTSSTADSAAKKRKTNRLVVGWVGLGVAATSVPCVVMMIHDLVAGADNLQGAVGAGSFFFVLMLIGLGATWWGLLARRFAAAAGAADAIERRVLTAAKALKGKVSPATLAVETGLTLDESEEALDEMVERGVAETWVSDQGNLIYAFPAFANPDDRLSATDPLDDDSAFDELEALEELAAAKEAVQVSD